MAQSRNLKPNELIQYLEPGKIKLKDESFLTENLERNIDLIGVEFETILEVTDVDNAVKRDFKKNIDAAQEQLKLAKNHFDIDSLFYKPDDGIEQLTKAIQSFQAAYGVLLNQQRLYGLSSTKGSDPEMKMRAQVIAAVETEMGGKGTRDAALASARSENAAPDNKGTIHDVKAESQLQLQKLKKDYDEFVKAFNNTINSSDELRKKIKDIEYHFDNRSFLSPSMQLSQVKTNFDSLKKMILEPNTPAIKCLLDMLKKPGYESLWSKKGTGKMTPTLLSTIKLLENKEDNPKENLEKIVKLLKEKGKQNKIFHKLKFSGLPLEKAEFNFNNDISKFSNFHEKFQYALLYILQAKDNPTECNKRASVCREYFNTEVELQKRKNATLPDPSNVGLEALHTGSDDDLDWDAELKNVSRTRESGVTDISRGAGAGPTSAAEPTTRPRSSHSERHVTQRVSIARESKAGKTVSPPTTRFKQERLLGTRPGEGTDPTPYDSLRSFVKNFIDQNILESKRTLGSIQNREDIPEIKSALTWDDINNLKNIEEILNSHTDFSTNDEYAVFVGDQYDGEQEDRSAATKLTKEISAIITKDVKNKWEKHLINELSSKDLLYYIIFKFCENRRSPSALGQLLERLPEDIGYQLGNALKFPGYEQPKKSESQASANPQVRSQAAAGAGAGPGLVSEAVAPTRARSIPSVGVVADTAENANTNTNTTSPVIGEELTDDDLVDLDNLAQTRGRSTLSDKFGSAQPSRQRATASPVGKSPGPAQETGEPTTRALGRVNGPGAGAGADTSPAIADFTEAELKALDQTVSARAGSRPTIYGGNTNSIMASIPQTQRDRSKNVAGPPIPTNPGAGIAPSLGGGGTRSRKCT